MNDGATVVMGNFADEDDRTRVALVDCKTPYKRGTGYMAQCAERDANARLIAAAPEMLEALKLAREYVVRVHGTIASAQGHENTIVKPDIDKIDAVLAKVGG